MPKAWRQSPRRGSKHFVTKWPGFVAIRACRDDGRLRAGVKPREPDVPSEVQTAIDARGGQRLVRRPYPDRVVDRSAGTCVLCPAPSRGVGEHVWSKWFIKDHQGEGPFTIEKDGVLYRKRNGGATWPDLQGVHVPMCEACNSRLNRTIEEPAKEIVRQFLPTSEEYTWPSVRAAGVGALARWFLKVGLLKAHPRARHDCPQVHRDTDHRRDDRAEPELLDWMRNDSSPNGFSVFALRRGIRGQEPSNEEKRVIFLPHITIGTKDLHYMTWTIGIRDLEVSIVWHPGWPIVHPLVEEGRVAKLWPNPSQVNFAELPEVHPDAFRFCPIGITMALADDEELQRAAQTPLQADMDPISHFMRSPL